MIALANPSQVVRGSPLSRVWLPPGAGRPGAAHRPTRGVRMTQSTGTGRSTAASNGHETAARSVAQVEADLAAARARLAGTVDDLAEAVSPQELAKRQG